MINESMLFFLSASFLITLALIVASIVFFMCIKYIGHRAGIHTAPDSLLQRLYK